MQAPQNITTISAAVFSEREMIGCTLTTKTADIDEGRETFYIKTDSQGRKSTRYFWVSGDGLTHSNSFATPELCRNFRRLSFGHPAGRKFIRESEEEAVA